MKKIAANVLLVVGSIVLAYLVVEAFARFKAYERYVKGEYPMAALHFVKSEKAPGTEKAQLGWAEPNSEYYKWRIDEKCHVVFKMDFHANNLGLVSRHDQPVARSGKEFRIVVIGDSFTASCEMSIPWTDILEDELNSNTSLREKLGGARIVVYNFGYPGGGFLDFKRMSESAKALDPDLVIVNYIEADIHRCNNCFEEDEPSDSRPPLQLVTGQIPFPVEGEPVVPTVSVTCEQPPVSFDNATCRHSFSLDAPSSIIENPEKLSKLKQRILHEFVRGQLWTSLYPYAIREAMGKPVSLTELRNADKYVQKPRKMKSFTDDEQVAQAVSVLNGIKSTYKNTIITRHPDYEDLTGTGTDNMSRRIVSENPSLRVIDMRQYLPSGLDKKEYYSWFCLPEDGHMCQKGGYVYAKAMAGIIERDVMR